MGLMFGFAVGAVVREVVVTCDNWVTTEKTASKMPRLTFRITGGSEIIGKVASCSDDGGLTVVVVDNGS